MCRMAAETSYLKEPNITPNKTLQKTSTVSKSEIPFSFCDIRVRFRLKRV